MTQESVSIIVAVVSGVLGALIGGGTAIVVYGRSVKAVLASPVLVSALENLAASWPAPVREAVHETGDLLATITPQTITSTPTAPIDPASKPQPGTVG